MSKPRHVVVREEEPFCPDCLGNCAPECGRHPAGCLFSGQVYGYWKIAPECKLAHHDVARARAEDILNAMRTPVRVLGREGWR